MTSDSFINLSKVKSILPSFPFRQATTQWDGSQSVGRQTSYFNTISRSSTNVIATGSAELKSDLPGHTSPPEDSTLTTQLRTFNVVLFGETGVGKSSVINLIAQKEVAKVSSDVNGCTMQSTRYDIPFGDLNFAIFDTIGLEEPQMGVNGYLKAIEKAYELIVKLGAAGGIHLLLFCMRGGRITATTQSNYRLFYEGLCSTKVPIALVFTGLEREAQMEDWWTRNKTHIEHYGIKSDGHACITAVQDDIPGEDLKYTESQKRIRELLKSCALKNEAFLLEPHSWFVKLGKGLRSFIEKHKNPKRRDVMKVLTNRCKLDSETARKIVDMMEKGDNQDEQEGRERGCGKEHGEKGCPAEPPTQYQG
ncbi:P-loop containing nucleoside triphosphate hydrolase protein [Lanmaoa asiatica]|nr:P-loop containing nucleoside triphosphate hydrolase protein [Lanmaoa asiatica]